MQPDRVVSSTEKKAGSMDASSCSTAQASPMFTVALELKAMLIIYDRLIALLNESCDEGLDILTESLSALTAGCRAFLALDDAETREREGRQMVMTMREGLREFPQTLRALLPGIGPRLGESLEHRMGIRFSRF